MTSDPPFQIGRSSAVFDNAGGRIMTPEQVTYIEESWAKVVPIGSTAATLFYDRLFELDPALRALFPRDMAAQREKLIMMLDYIVKNLRDLPNLLPKVRALGERHVQYGVQPSHYETVGKALMWTLAQGLGDAFTAPVQAAWRAAYDALATTMQEAPSQHHARQMTVA